MAPPISPWIVAARGRVAAALAVAGPLIGLTVLRLALLEVFRRRLVARGQSAATTDELVWDDALRSSALNYAQTVRMLGVSRSDALRMVTAELAS